MRDIPFIRLLGATLVLILLVFCSSQLGSAQTPLPLGLDNNYMVTGDYVVSGWSKAAGSITIPDQVAYGTNTPLQVPPGADIVAAFLYWQTVENSGTPGGQNGFFGGSPPNVSVASNPITGTMLGILEAPVSWSSGGCAGSSQGSKTIVAYRADVSALLPIDSNGNALPNTTYQVSLPDTGKPSQPPFDSGATLVIIYRLLGVNSPLTAVIIYDGAYAPSTSSQTITLPLQGFFQAGNDQSCAIVSKITHAPVSPNPPVHAIWSAAGRQKPRIAI